MLLQLGFAICLCYCQLAFASHCYMYSLTHYVCDQTYVLAVLLLLLPLLLSPPLTAAGDSAKMAKSALTLLLLVACAASAMAYPSFWPGRAPNCQALPTAGIACHKAPQDDK